jgi:hypothetical protein
MTCAEVNLDYLVAPKKLWPSNLQHVDPIKSSLTDRSFLVLVRYVPTAIQISERNEKG